MSWFKNTKDEDLPEELKGKTPQEVAAALKDANTLREKVTTLEAQRTTERETVTRLQTEFEGVKSQLANISANRPATVPTVPEEQANFIEDPDKAFNQRVAPVAQLAVQNASLTAKLLAQQQLDNADQVSDGKKMDGRLFRAWESEIIAESKKYNPIQLTQPENWVSMFYMIKGRHSDELRDPETRKKNYSFLEPARHTAPPEEKKKDGIDSLSPEEIRIAGRLKITPENYLKRKKEMQVVY